VDDYCDVLKTEIHITNATITRLSSHAKDIWKSPRGTVIRIEILVVLAAFFFLFLGVFGRYRRQSRNLFVQKGVFGVYTLSSSLVAYTLGSMQSSSVKSSMYRFWAISLFILHGCTDSITAHSLGDNKEIMKNISQMLVYYMYGAFLIISYPNITTSRKNMMVFYLFGFYVVKFSHRISAFFLATGSGNVSKTVADYMYQKHKIGWVFDPATMKGCHYLVDWPIGKFKMDNETYAIEIAADHNEVIDIEKIWLCRSLGRELKYECLSFSLCHLLRRRIFGFACGESKINAHNFVFKGLLSDPENDYSRVFKVIETELAFIYDFCFTKYAVIYYKLRAATIWYLVSVASICFAIYVVATDGGKYNCSRTKDQSFIVNTKADFIITFVILATAGLHELVQMLIFYTSIWGRVSFACQHIREEEAMAKRGRVNWCCMMIMLRLKGLLAKIGVRCGSNKNHWLHELGQHSLIDAVSYRSDPSAAKGKDTNLLSKLVKITLQMDQGLYLRNIHLRSTQASNVRGNIRPPMKLNSQVKKALVLSLVRTQGKLTNGKSSLVANEAGSLSWACEWDVHPQTACIILTWHIATSYCEMMITSRGGPSGEETKSSVHFGVATALSRYCAHLMVSQPKLLPGNHYDTSYVFDTVAEEATKFLQSETNKYEAMKNLMLPPPTVFGRGVALGKQLEVMPEGICWKVMADFWAEMLLYLAPSDEVDEHIEKLANGGEFITHIWALLSHAGILARDNELPVGSV
jgi:hypothetical protein